MRVAELERSTDDMGGIQRLYRFPNGYGASVVCHHGSYGWVQGLWELAVLTFSSDDIGDFHLVYSTPITSDVLGYLKEDAVDSYLAQIEHLPKKGA